MVRSPFPRPKNHLNHLNPTGVRETTLQRLNIQTLQPTFMEPEVILVIPVMETQNPPLWDAKDDDKEVF